MLHNVVFLLYNKVNQLYVYIYPHNLSLLSLPPTLPIPSLQVVTKHRVDLLVLCSSFPLANHFTFGSVCMSMLLPHFIPASPSHLVPSSPFSTSASLFLPCHQVDQYRFLKFHIYVLAYGIYFSLSDLLHSVRQILGPSTSLPDPAPCNILTSDSGKELRECISNLRITKFADDINLIRSEQKHAYCSFYDGLFLFIKQVLA